MKVNGVSRFRLPTLKRPDLLIGIITKSMNNLCLLAPRRRKNYIIDMTNFLEDRREKKLMGFEEFNRKCMVFVPDENEHQRRLMRHEGRKGEKLNTDLLMLYKAVMSIPILAEGEPLEDVLFVDPEAGRKHIVLDRVAKMNHDGKLWLQMPRRREGGDGYHHHQRNDPGNYHNDYHQYNNGPFTSGPPSGSGYSNQYSPRGGNNSINFTHTTFQPGQSSKVREEDILILSPVIMGPEVVQNPSTSNDSTPAIAAASPASARPIPSQFSFPPPASPAVSVPVAAPSTPVVPQSVTTSAPPMSITTGSNHDECAAADDGHRDDAKAKNRVSPPNFATPPPQLVPMTPTQQPLMMYHPQMPPPTAQQYIYPPQCAPR